MNLPTEIDQDVACPECGRPLFMEPNGEGMCENGDCERGRLYSPKVIAALRNQLPPNHTAIPNAELEELRRWHSATQTATDAIGIACLRESCDAILAHLPEKKPDHVERIRLMIEFRRDQLPSHDYAPATRERILREIAALEAAIEWGKKLGEKA